MAGPAYVWTTWIPVAGMLLVAWFNWNFDPANHWAILIVTLVLLVIQSTLNIAGAKVMGLIAQFGVYVEILGTIGLSIVLAIHGFHHGLGYLFTTQGVQHVKTNPLGLDFGGSYFGALLIAVLAPVYIFYGFESAGDISEEAKTAHCRPRSGSRRFTRSSRPRSTRCRPAPW